MITIIVGPESLEARQAHIPQSNKTPPTIAVTIGGKKIGSNAGTYEIPAIKKGLNGNEGVITACKIDQQVRISVVLG